MAAILEWLFRCSGMDDLNSGGRFSLEFRRRLTLACAVFLTLAITDWPAWTANSADPSRCELLQEASRFVGSCGAVFDQTPTMTLAPATTIRTGIWRADARPSSVWVGDMTDKGYPNAALELEVYANGTKNQQTENGWYPVSHFNSSPSTMNFLLVVSL